MSGDLPSPKSGEKAPEPDDGRYHVVEVNPAEKTMLIRWEAKGRTYTCWVPQDAFDKIETH